MKQGQLLHLESGKILLPQVRRTDNAWDRFCGLLGSPAPKRGEGMLLTPCNSIHMFFMRYPLDILFLDQKGTVLSRRQSLRPWRMAGERKAAMVLECRAGELSLLNISDGEKVQWQANNS